MQFWLLIGSLLLASTAWAQEDDAAKQADNRVNAAAALERGNKLAGKGKFADAVGYYEKALRLDPEGSELAYYNLAEVQNARGNCRDAVLIWQLYASALATAEARAEADRGIEACKTVGWPTLELKVEPAQDGVILVNGILASRTGVFGPLVVPTGTYEIRFSAPDHHPSTADLDVKAGPVSHVEPLKKMTFFGTIVVKPNVEGAQIRVYEGPSDKTEQLHDGKSPMKKGVKVREGRHFVEVTAKGHERWIRNIQVGRDVDVVVDVEMRRSLPQEIQ